VTVPHRSELVDDPWALTPGYPAAPYVGLDPYTALYGQEPGPRSLRGLGTCTALLLVCQAVVSVVAAGFAAWGVLSWSKLSGAPAGLQLPPDRAGAVLLLFSSPLTLATGVTFISWLYLAAVNARRRGAAPRRPAGWAIAGWFVPVLSLWRPKQVLDDIWRASVPGVPPGIDLRKVPKSCLVTGWWAAWLLAGALPGFGPMRAVYAGLAPNLQALRDGSPARVPIDTARMHETVALYGLWSAVLLVLAAGLAAAIVVRVTGWQQEWAAADR